MQRLLSLGAASLLFTVVVLSGSALRSSGVRAESAGMQDRFVGAWRLVSLEEADASGKVYRADCTGLLAYTRDGHMSVQVMYRNPEMGGQAGPVQYAQGGYEASFGSYQIDESSRTFTFHVEGAMVRSLIGKDLPRAFEFAGQRLIVKSANANEHWQATWEHY